MIDVEESTFDLFLRYGLFFGAVFQLVCIGAAIFGPDMSESHSKVTLNSKNIISIYCTNMTTSTLNSTALKTIIQEDNSEDSGSEHGSPTNAGHKHSSGHSRRKMDKKKRRWTANATPPHSIQHYSFIHFFFYTAESISVAIFYFGFRDEFCVVMTIQW